MFKGDFCREKWDGRFSDAQQFLRLESFSREKSYLNIHVGSIVLLISRRFRFWLVGRKIWKG